MFIAFLIALPFIAGLVTLRYSKDLFVGWSLFVMFVIISAFVFLIKDAIETENCKESSVKVIPQIVHVSDSSEKILKYNGKTIKTISRNSFEFYVPESLFVLDTCDNSISVKGH